MKELVTNSRLSAYRRCPRFHRLRYVDLLVPANEDTAKRDWGTAFHAALEIYLRSLERDLTDEAYRAIMEAPLDDYAKRAALVVFHAYVAYWRASDVADKVPIGAEMEFRAPLINPDYDGDFDAICELYDVGGKMDGMFVKDGKVFVMEHKTTSSDISPGSAYWLRLHLDSQVSTYIHGAKAHGHDVFGTCYDVIKRPSTKPKKATPVEKRKFKKDGTLYKNQRELDETPNEYGERIAADIAEDPSEYFRRCTVVRSETEMVEAQRDTWQTTRAMHDSLVNGTDYKNPDACEKFGSMCEFFDLCTGAASADDETRFVKLASKHPELNTVK